MNKKVKLSIIILLVIFIVYMSSSCLERFFILNKEIPKILHKTGPLTYSNLSHNTKELLSKTIEMNPDFKLEYYTE